MPTTSAQSDTELKTAFQRIRRFTEQLTESLSPEDCMVQSMEDASPIRWHLAHTTWFFETFLLKGDPAYVEVDPHYAFLFNSYYNSVGKQFPRPHRGVISRPGLAEVRAYRATVDQAVEDRLGSQEFVEKHRNTILVGLHHEQQHQELILADFKHALSCNPLLPTWLSTKFDREAQSNESWLPVEAGLYEIGHQGTTFCFDNELPVHSTYVNSFELGKDLVTCGQFIEFIEAGGYQRPEYWLSAGWSQVQAADWDAPLYWVKQDGRWMVYTLAGLVEVNSSWPICHVSYFEADAFARWAGYRLPTEFEWEIAWRKMSTNSESTSQEGEPFADELVEQDLAIHPTRSPQGLCGGVWQWTSSSYQAYPGYKPAPGAIGEYNGKFMCNQYVLRGGSVATSSSHIRGTYRNFFPSHMRWQFCGLRLAR